jgi:hypothetical protein
LRTTAPTTVIRAFAPGRRIVAGLELQALTCAHMVALARCGAWDGGADLRPLCALDVLSTRAADVLGRDIPHAEDPAWELLAEAMGTPVEDVAMAITEHLLAAFEPRIPIRPPDGTETLHSSPTLGIAAELVEALMHNYKMDIEAALTFPVARAFVLMAAAAQRQGLVFGGPDYATREEEEVKSEKLKVRNETRTTDRGSRGDAEGAERKLKGRSEK